MNVEKNVSELIDYVGKIKNAEARKAALRELCFNNNAIATLFQYTFHPKIDFYKFDKNVLDAIEYTNEFIGSPAPMYRAIRQLKNLCVIQNPDVSVEKRENIFHGMLGVVRPADKEILLSVVFERKFPHKYLTKEFVMDAMPELFPQVEVAA